MFKDCVGGRRRPPALEGSQVSATPRVQVETYLKEILKRDDVIESIGKLKEEYFKQRNDRENESKLSARRERIKRKTDSSGPGNLYICCQQ